MRCNNMSYGSSNMLDLDGPIVQMFTGFLLAIIGCMVIINDPDLTQFSVMLLIGAGVLVALALMNLANA